MANGLMADYYLRYLECSACGAQHEAEVPQNVCASCARPLLARYDLQALDGRGWRDRLARRPWTLWRYAELLPLRRPEEAVSLGEGVTTPRSGHAHVTVDRASMIHLPSAEGTSSQGLPVVFDWAEAGSRCAQCALIPGLKALGRPCRDAICHNARESRRVWQQAGTTRGERT
jgi:hypothetical protein